MRMTYICSGAEGGSGRSESSKKNSHTFFERMGCSGYQKSESAVLQKSESAMLYFLIFCTEVGENYVIHTNL